MTFKRYITINGKRYGPYSYKSYRDKNGRVKNYYFGKKENRSYSIIGGKENDQKSPFKFYSTFYIPLIIGIILAILASNFSMTGYSISAFERPEGINLDKSSFQANEPLTGYFSLYLQNGELIPSDASIFVEANGITKEISLSEFFSLSNIDLAPEYGDFYSTKAEISGQGSGYGFIGEKKSYPEVSFELNIIPKQEEAVPALSDLIQNAESEQVQEEIIQEQPVEQQTEEIPAEIIQEQPAEEAPIEIIQEEPLVEDKETILSITGNVISEINPFEQGILSGECTAERNFVHTIGDSEAEIVPGSVKSSETLDDSAIRIRKEGSEVLVSTDYTKTESGFGKEYLTENTERIDLDINALNISFENPGDYSLKISLNYAGNKIAEFEKEIAISSTESAPEIPEYQVKNIITDAKGDKINANVEFIRNHNIQGAISSISEAKISEGVYDVKITGLEKTSIKEILIKGCDIIENTSEIIQVDEAPESGDFLEIYALNPHENFSSAEVTVTAKGTELYKCKEWNFPEQRCYGEWVKLMDITPGQEYTFVLAPEDPGFAESVLTGYVLHNEADSQYPSYQQIKNESADSSQSVSSAVDLNSKGIKCWSNKWIMPSFSKAIKVNGTWNFTVYYSKSGGTSVNYLFSKIIKINSSGEFNLANSSSSADIGAIVAPTAVTWTYAFNSNNAVNADERIGIQICTNVTSEKNANAYIYWEGQNYSRAIIPVAIYDDISPSISFISPTLPSGSSTKSTFEIKVNATDARLSSIIIRIYNSNHQWIDQFSSFSSPADYNAYGYPDGLYFYNATACDTLSNCASTETRNITVDNTPTSIIIYSPLNQTYNNMTQLVNVSTADPATIWLSFNNSNQSYSSPMYSTFSEGSNTLTVYAMDLAGNLNSTSVKFSIDTTPPASISNLKNISAGETWIYWNWTNPMDSDFNSSIIFIDEINVANVSGKSYNSTGLSSGSEHFIAIWTKDNLGNINCTNINLSAFTLGLDLTAPVIKSVSPANGSSLAAGTTETTIYLVANELSTCRYGLADEAWENMSEMNSTISKEHDIHVSGLSDGSVYDYYFLCKDPSNNLMNQSYHLRFSVLSQPYTPPSGGTGSNSGSAIPSGGAAVYIPQCDEDWACTNWTECSEQGTQIRACTDLNECRTAFEKPEETQNCTKPTCSDGIKNQDELGIDCGGQCPKRCAINDITGSLVKVQAPDKMSKSTYGLNLLILLFVLIGVIIILNKAEYKIKQHMEDKKRKKSSLKRMKIELIIAQIVHIIVVIGIIVLIYYFVKA